ncbi:MAG: hypothetical protein HN370_04450 [Phycisphaerales bacterium]|jgi:hypothetical protein|nr:hypothetical protein [Phycisphaerales bacterium]
MKPSPTPTTRRRVLSWLPRVLAGGALVGVTSVAMRGHGATPAHKASCVGGGLCAYCASSSACIRPAAQSYRFKRTAQQGARRG